MRRRIAWVRTIAGAAAAISAASVSVSAAVAAVAPPAFGQNALESIDACIRRLDPQTDVGYGTIAARCPDLTRQLEGSSWAAWLPPDWQRPGNDLTAESLAALRIQVQGELALTAPSRAASLESLHGILNDLGPLEPQRAGWWSRLTLWLRDVFERRDPSPSAGWLDRMTARVGPSQATIELISYLCLAAVVVLAAGLVSNELRLAGLFGARRRRSNPEHPVRSAANSAQGWEEIQRAPYGDRPRMLLELIAARLIEMGRLPKTGGLTVRELTNVAHLAEGEDRALLADVALTAERVRFSGEQVSRASLDAAVERGRTLLEHLRR